jgi:outer membrane receptor protein involved in Fe transport
LRGPQGTLYGRNATAGVVNLISAKPSDQFEAMASADIGNYGNRRLEGMINIPIVDDRADLRIAGEWTKRQGYSFNELDDQRIDGRDLWSSRVTLGFKPVENLQAYLVWEHFSEDDDRMRTSKQLCSTDPVPAEVGGVPVPPVNDPIIGGPIPYRPAHYLSQGCRAASLYSADSFEVPNGLALPYYAPLGITGAPLTTAYDGDFDPYASTTQSRNLRVIETQLNPQYKAKNDTLELNADYNFSPSLTFSSQTGYNQDSLWSTEDYNRFDTTVGAFSYSAPTSDPVIAYHDPNKLGQLIPDPNGLGLCLGGLGTILGDCEPSGFGGSSNAQCHPLAGSYTDPVVSNDYKCIPMGVFCDPQLGCSDRLVAEDLSDEKAWQLSQEFRLASHFSGPLNFSVGGNYLHYETEENYYVFINTLTLATIGWGSNGQTQPYVPGVSDNGNCLVGGFQDSNPFGSNQLGGEGGSNCQYIDPNPLNHLNNKGHNYFLSQNPYALNSYAGFGEAYYDVLSDLKLTAGVRWTEDQKHFTLIPSELLIAGYGYPSTGVINQQWDQLTGRAAINWTPKLAFTDQTLVYGTYSHGYKAGGANPPGAELLVFGNSGQTPNPIHPLTFKPEFVDAFELGSKNTLLDGALTFNADVFYYNYENYQISRIVDRTSINDNFDAHVKGAEVESTWEPVAGLRFNFAGGWEDTAIAKGSKSVDLIDRTDAANHPDWVLVKPFVTQTSNCILPVYVVAAMLEEAATQGLSPDDGGISGACAKAYGAHVDPLTGLTYASPPVPAGTYPSLPPGYPGFDPLAGTPGDPYTGQNTANGHDYGPVPNSGQGFDKDLSGNKLPNAPPFTVSFGAQYTMPLTTDWAGTLRGDYYWQDYSWARVFNDNPYDRIRGYTNINLTLIFTNQNGWQVMLYDKNVFNETAITGTFLNSDDSGLTTNVFLTDPKLIGIRVTKNW